MTEADINCPRCWGAGRVHNPTPPERRGDYVPAMPCPACNPSGTHAAADINPRLRRAHTAGVMAAQARLGHRLARHMNSGDDPCQDRGVDWPCDVAEAFMEPLDVEP